MRTWPLTGRAEELKVIAEVLGGGGERAGVAIVGRAGVGKTRLAREAVVGASERGWAVRWVVGTVAAQSIPLGAFAQWNDRLDGDPLRLVRSVIAAITASPNDKPVLVAVDDAHLLDNLSAFVLHQLVLRGAAIVIATVRTGEPAPDAVTALWKDARLQRLDLQPLSRPESHALLETVLGGRVSTQCADRMWRLTRGNVLYLHELVNQELRGGGLITRDNAWQWPGPMAVSPSLVDVVNVHIGAAPEPVLDVIDLVALAEPFELAYLASLADSDAIEESERHGLITVSRASTGEVVRIGHPLYGEARLAQSGQVRLARLRGLIARAMTTLDAAVDPPDPVRLGLLWLDSDLPPDHDVLTRAAQAAVMRLDIALAQRLAEAAVGAGAGVDAHLLRAHTLSLLSRGEEAEHVVAGLIARELPDAARSTAVHLRARNLLWPLGRSQASWQVIDDGLAAASGQTATDLLAFRAVQLATAARPAEVVTICDCIDRHELSALPALMLTWARTIVLGDLGHPLQAATVAEEGAALAAGSPQAACQAVPLAVPLVMFHVQALVLGGHIAQAGMVVKRAYQQYADVPGIPHTTATAAKGVAALANGDLHTAVECLRRATDECERRQANPGLNYHFLVFYTEALARAGKVDAAVQALTRMQQRRHPSYAFIESDSLLAGAWVAAARDSTSEARELARRAAEFARNRGQHAREVLCLQAAIHFGDNAHASRLVELAGLVEGPRAVLVTRWAVGVDHGDGDALLDVSRDFEVMGDHVAAADAAAHASRAFRRRNRRGAALTAGCRAGRIITECGAATPATRAAVIPLPLTDREREIATRVSEGLSNKEIAVALTVSVRTVEGHIYRACNNLGAANRTELGRLVSDFAAIGNHLFRTDIRPHR